MQKEPHRKPDPPLPTLASEEQEGEAEVVFSLNSSHAEEDSSSEEDEEMVQPRAKKRNIKDRTASMLLDEREEMALAKWYKEHEQYFNKKLRSYKNTEEKKRLMKEKAESMGYTYHQVYTFFKSMRTRYVKLRKDLTKSGRARLDLTERELFIVELFQFLDAHITKSKTRKSAKFPTTSAASASAADSRTAYTHTSRIPESMSGALDIMVPDDDVVVVKEEPADTFTTFGKGKGQGKATASTSSQPLDTQQLTLKLVDQATELGQVREAMAEPMTPKEKEVEVLLGFLQTQMMKIPDENWWDFTMEIMSLVRRHQVQQFPMQQPYQPQQVTQQLQQMHQMPQQMPQQQQFGKSPTMTQGTPSKKARFEGSENQDVAIPMTPPSSQEKNGNGSPCFDGSVSPEQRQKMEENKLNAKMKLTAKKTEGLVANMGTTWYKALEAEFEKPYFQQLAKFVATERQRYTIYPPQHQVFSFTQVCDIKQVKVVILGQDPYHGHKQAHGLCFSVQKGVSPPPSLENMYKELVNDIEGFHHPGHGDLTGWAQQGVLLLNACLTVRASQANSHKDKGWEKFTDAVVAWLNRNQAGLVFLLWGSYAQKKGACIDKKKHHVLKAVHPSPLSAYRGFFGCKHFSHANKLLKDQGKKPIDWMNLPQETH